MLSIRIAHRRFTNISSYINMPIVCTSCETNYRCRCCVMPHIYKYNNHTTREFWFICVRVRVMLRIFARVYTYYMKCNSCIMCYACDDYGDIHGYIIEYREWCNNVEILRDVAYMYVDIWVVTCKTTGNIVMCINHHMLAYIQTVL